MSTDDASTYGSGESARCVHRLDRAWRRLGRDERAVLVEIAQGLVAGRRVYGELRLARDRRDLEREALEEVRDALVYVGAALVRRRRRRL